MLGSTKARSAVWMGVMKEDMIDLLQGIRGEVQDALAERSELGEYEERREINDNGRRQRVISEEVRELLYLAVVDLRRSTKFILMSFAEKHHKGPLASLQGSIRRLADEVMRKKVRCLPSLLRKSLTVFAKQMNSDISDS